MPYHQSVLHDVTPVYEELPGWQTDLSHGHEVADLPPKARDYLGAAGGAGGCAGQLRRHRARPGPVRAAALMRVCVVGVRRAGARAGRRAVARPADVVVTPGNPGIPGSVATPAGGAGRPTST